MSLIGGYVSRDDLELTSVSFCPAKPQEGHLRIRKYPERKPDEHLALIKIQSQTFPHIHFSIKLQVKKMMFTTGPDRTGVCVGKGGLGKGGGGAGLLPAMFLKPIESP